ncbi:hypothetical protein BaRGS_00016908 [Batillaria attramentaria]|uniref:Uncharacterized protein n=1 Tax=Batillaria attramentaria TaxID=370345 RepID=A0ABD0KYJ8_9CAEN
MISILFKVSSRSSELSKFLSSPVTALEKVKSNAKRSSPRITGSLNPEQCRVSAVQKLMRNKPGKSGNTPSHIPWRVTSVNEAEVDDTV